MISGLVLKYLNGECFVIRRGYETTLPRLKLVLSDSPRSHGLGLVFIALNYHRFMGFYYTPSWMALLGMRGLVHGPRPEQN